MPTRDRRRDTPAQDRNFQERRTRGDVSAFQQAGLQLQDRRLENEAVAGAVQAATRPQPRSYGNSGSPTLREAGQGAVAAARGAYERGRAEAPGPGPGFSAQTTEADGVGAQRGAANLPRGAGQGSGFTASQLAGQQPPRTGGRSPSMPRGSAQGSGFTDQQLGTGSPGWGPALFERLANIPAPGQAIRNYQARRAEGGTPPAASQPSQPSQPSQLAAQPQGRSSQQVLRDVNTAGVQSALAAGRQAEEAGRGFYTDPQGNRVTVPGTRRAQDDATGLPGLSVMGDMGAANEEFARANQIRQQTIDRQRPQNQVTVIGEPGQRVGGGQGGGVNGDIERLAARAGRESNPRRRAQINSQIRALQGIADRDAATQRTELTNLANLQRQGMADNAAFERAAMQSLQTDTGQQAYQAARANYYNAQAERAMRGEAPEPPQLPDVQRLVDAGFDEMAEQEMARYQAERDQYDLSQYSQQIGVSPQEMMEDYFEGAEMGPLEPIFERMFGPRDVPEENRYAMGGEVAPPMEGAMGPSAMGMPDPGMDAMPPAMMDGPGMAEPPMMAEYQRYMEGAQQAGVPTLPYEDFVNLMPQAQPMPEPAPGGDQPFAQMGFADGGLIPGQEEMLASQIGATMGGMGGMGGMDVSGREVVDPDPMAGTDSIPAVIDGQYPAALDSGEFVIPEHVVRFHGLDKLQKMIAQAEKGGSNGQDRATESV